MNKKKTLTKKQITDVYEAAMLNQALEDLKKGKIKDGKTVIKEIKDKYNL